MGLVKSLGLEVEERGWYEPDGHVCADCVEDEFLQQVIRQNLSHRECTYCGRKTRAKSAAPVAVIMEPIGRAVSYYFSDPTLAGVPYDGGFLVESMGTEDALMSLQLKCEDRLFDAIAQAFVVSEWVPAAGGHWASSHPNEVMSYSWNSFVSAIRHEARFFFQQLPASTDADPQEYAPAHVLPAIGKLVKELQLCRQLPRGTALYRVRERAKGAEWQIDAFNMGAPPSKRAKAGRMNPAGISYLYMALEQETALAEVLSSPPCEVAIACFETKTDLNVLDLANLPKKHSIFDDDQRSNREGLLFLAHFVAEISNPVRKDGREHIEYVPSQVVSEFFALEFRDLGGLRLDGVMYPSSVRPGGLNLVLFPSERGLDRRFDQVVFKRAEEKALENWAKISDALS